MKDMANERPKLRKCRAVGLPQADSIQIQEQDVCCAVSSEPQPSPQLEAIP